MPGISEKEILNCGREPKKKITCRRPAPSFKTEEKTTLLGKK